MKKSLIALAALATVATAAQAQSSVTVYGIVDTGIIVDNHAAAGSSTKMGNVLATSRLGFRGTEDLGSGLKANFNLESELAETTGAAGTTTSDVASLFNRQSWVGLDKSDIGSIQLGRTTRFDFDLTVNNDPFAAANFGGAAHVVFGALTFNGSNGSNSSRFVDSAKFTSARLAGFQAGYQHALGGNAGDASREQGESVAINYVQGNARVDYAYARVNADAAGGAKAYDASYFAGNYNFGVAKVFAGYGQKEKAGVAVKSKATWVGAVIPVNAKINVMAQYSDLENVATTATTGDPVDGADAKTWALGLTYDFSKRTAAYAMVGGANNSSTSNVRVTTRGAAAATGKDTTAYTVGIRHSF